MSLYVDDSHRVLVLIFTGFKEDVAGYIVLVFLLFGCFFFISVLFYFVPLLSIVVLFLSIFPVRSFLGSDEILSFLFPFSRIPIGSPSASSRKLSWLEHGVSSGDAYVGGRGCFHYVCSDGSLLQVSRSTQKLLPVPKVSEQKTDRR